MGSNIVMKWYLYDWGGLNVWLFHFINNIHNSILDSIMLAATASASHELFSWYLAILSLAATGAIARTSRDQMDGKALLWITTVTVFSVAYLVDGWLLGVLKPLLNFPRPPLALPIETVYIIGQAEYHHSLPSGHSSFAMLIAASIWPLLIVPWQKYFVIGFVILVGISRISLGAHFPADIIAGWILSLLIILLVRSVINQYTLGADCDGKRHDSKII
jgi:membrane-associated phospholipid phosphatase